MKKKGNIKLGTSFKYSGSDIKRGKDKMPPTTTKNPIEIAGAGVAGSTVARILAKKSSFRVKLYEKRKNPEGVCAGAIGLPHIRENKDIFSDMPEEIIQSKPEKIMLSSRNEGVLWDARSIDEPFFGYILDRREFDKYLVNMAVDEGVQYIPNTVKKSPSDLYSYFILANGGPPFTDDIEELKYDANYKISIQYYVKSEELSDENTMKMYFDDLNKTGGYIWHFPISDKLTKIGIGTKSGYTPIKSHLKTHLNNFGVDYKILKKEGGIIPSFTPDKFHRGKCVTVGDRAGTCSSFHGGGIGLSIKTGRILGNHISSGNDLSEYKYSLFPVIEALENQKKMGDTLCSLSPKGLDKLFRSIDGEKMNNLGKGNIVSDVLKQLFLKHPIFCLKILFKLKFT